jgi:hypothetical protein
LKKWFVLCSFSIFSLTANAWTLVAPGLQGWSPGTVLVAYNFSDCPLPESVLLPSLRGALKLWNSVENASLELVLVESSAVFTVADFFSGAVPHHPIVLCDTDFSKSQAVDGSTIPAATRVSATSGRLQTGAVFLNAEEGSFGNIVRLSRSELEIVMAHEMGHALGLGHSERQDALMYFSLNGKDKPALSSDDLQGLSFLYPRNELMVGPFGCSQATSRRTPARGFTAWFTFVLLLSLGLGRAFRYRGSIKPERLP